MKKFLKAVGILFGALLLAGILWSIMIHEPLPIGESGSEVDALAQKMLNALDYEKYKDTRFLHWSYRGGKNQYEWDRKKGVCMVQWEKNKVQLDVLNPEKSSAWVDGNPVARDKSSDLVNNALKMFHNDSFWLVAPYKVFDQGTERKIVMQEDGSKSLLVTYTSGGTTPGDSYLWLLQENGKPFAFKMWVEIIPIGGLQASWDSWLITESGAQLPKSHQFGPIQLGMGAVKGFGKID